MPVATILVLVLPALSPSQPVAAPLDGEACGRLKQEQTELAKAGIKQNMAKGPGWASSNLSPDKLAEIQRLIEVEEQIAFRCLQSKPAKSAAKATHPASAPQAGGSEKAEAKAKTAPVKSAAPKLVRPNASDAATPPLKHKDTSPSQE
jgi:hypothetical protein